MKYCTQCGNELQDEARFCSKCGAQSSLSPNENPPEMTAVEASPVVNEPVHNEGQSNMDQPAPDLPEEQAAAILMDSPEPAELEPTGALPMDEVPLPAATKLVPWIMAGVAVILILGVWAVYAMGNFGAAEIARL
ncbi:MAG: zinc-ribbon domain-containing protein, partial [Chitinophagales bacterium]